MSHWSENLIQYGACKEALEWARRQSSAKSAWNRCKRADWMLWIAAKKLDRKIVVMAACQCARHAQKHWNHPADNRPLNAIETAEAWARGEASIQSVRNAAAAAYAAAYAAACIADAAAAYAAACIADAADAAACIADACIAADAAAGGAAGGARETALADMAILVRKVIPWSVMKESFDESA